MRMQDYNPDAIIYLTDQRQSMHFVQMCIRDRPWPGEYYPVGIKDSGSVCDPAQH